MISALSARPPVWPRWGSTAPAGRRGALRGLYSGGTLADEAMLVLADLIGDVRSNIPLRPELALAPAGPAGPGWPGRGMRWSTWATTSSPSGGRIR